MKKLTAILLVLVLVFALAACGKDNKDNPLGLVEAGKLTMSTNAAFPPYEMTTDAGGYEGIDVEIAEAIAKKLGLKLQIDDMDFDSALLAVQQKKSDIVMAGVSVTPDRQLVISFSNSYATGVQVVIVPEGSKISTVDDLLNPDNGYKVGVQQDTTGDIYMSSSYEDGGVGEDNVIRYKTGNEAVQALLTGKVDAVVIDQEPAKAYVETNNN